MIRLFRTQREAEARQAMDALTEMVAPEAMATKDGWSVSLFCNNCQQWMTGDPQTTGRFLCPKCQGVAQAHAAFNPHKKETP